MNVYDFDNTIYDGESVFDFYIFCIKSQPRLAKYLYIVFKTFIKYKLCRMSIEEFAKRWQKHAVGFMDEIEDLDGKIDKFWEKKFHKIKPFYSELHKPDDVVISASFDVLIKKPCEQLGITNIIASEIDMETGHLRRLCYRKNKTELFKDKFGDVKIDNFYTDSINDIPMMKISEKTFLVKGKKITEYSKHLD